VAHTPASPAHHVVGHVGLVLALPCLVVRGPAVGALGHPVLSQGPVQQGQLPQLHLPQLVASLRNFHPLLDHFPDPPDRLVDGVSIRGSDISMQGLVFSWQWLPVFSPNLSLFDATLAPNDDLCTSILLHVLQSVPSWSNEKSDKVDVRMFLLGDHHLVRHLHCRRLIVRRSFVVRVDQHHLLDAIMPDVFEFFPFAIFSRVQPLPVPAVDRLRTWRPIILVAGDPQVAAPQLP